MFADLDRTLRKLLEDPLVPPAIGKLSICAAKMKAASTPSRGTRASSSSTLATRSP